MSMKEFTMFKTLALAAIATVTLTSFAEAQQRGYGHRGGGYGQQYRGGYGRQVNVYNRNVYVNRRGGWGGNGNAWAAGAAGLAVGALVGALAAQPAYAAPVPQYAPVGVVPGMNTVPGCFYAAFVDQYGQQFFRQICN
jgi:hypothetical protein